MQAKVQGLADANRSCWNLQPNSAPDKLRTDIEKGISGDVVVQQTKAISAFPPLASNLAN